MVYSVSFLNILMVPYWKYILVPQLKNVTSQRSIQIHMQLVTFLFENKSHKIFRLFKCLIINYSRPVNIAHWPQLTYSKKSNQKIIFEIHSRCIEVILTSNYVVHSNLYCLMLLNDRWPVDWHVSFSPKSSHCKNIKRMHKVGIVYCVGGLL